MLGLTDAFPTLTSCPRDDPSRGHDRSSRMTCRSGIHIRIGCRLGHHRHLPIFHLGSHLDTETTPLAAFYLDATPSRTHDPFRPSSVIHQEAGRVTRPSIFDYTLY